MKAAELKILTRRYVRISQVKNTSGAIRWRRTRKRSIKPVEVEDDHLAQVDECVEKRATGAASLSARSGANWAISGCVRKVVSPAMSSCKGVFYLQEWSEWGTKWSKWLYNRFTQFWNLPPFSWRCGIDSKSKSRVIRVIEAKGTWNMSLATYSIAREGSLLKSALYKTIWNGQALWKMSGKPYGFLMYLLSLNCCQQESVISLWMTFFLRACAKSSRGTVHSKLFLRINLTGWINLTVQLHR